MVNNEIKLIKKKQQEKVNIKGFKIEFDICKVEPINEGAKAIPGSKVWPKTSA